MPEQHGREVQPSLLVQGAHAAQKVLWKGMRSACSLCCEKGKEGRGGGGGKWKCQSLTDAGECLQAVCCQWVWAEGKVMDSVPYLVSRRLSVANLPPGKVLSWGKGLRWSLSLPM